MELAQLKYSIKYRPDKENEATYNLTRLETRTHQTKSWSWAAHMCCKFSPNLLLWLAGTYSVHYLIINCFRKFRTSEYLLRLSAILDMNHVLFIMFSPNDVLNCISIYKICVLFSYKNSIIEFVSFFFVFCSLEASKNYEKACYWGVTYINTLSAVTEVNFNLGCGNFPRNIQKQYPSWITYTFPGYMI